MMIRLLILAFVSSSTIGYGFFSSFPSIRKLNKMVLSCQSDSIFEDEEDFRRVASSYLLAKYKGCDEDGCRMNCDRSEVEDILNTVLPPVSRDELKREVDRTMSLLPGSNPEEVIDEDEFTAQVLENPYWKSAGPLVVKELIFLDTLHAHYYNGFNLLNDEEYDELKDMLVWEGSDVATMSGDEAHFLTCVAYARKGTPLIDDEEYAKLKSSLQAKGSWVANRGMDTLERLGMETFMGYLHREMNSQ